MKLLIIGGTVFLGRHLAQAALDAGHEVTLFNRGKHNPELFRDAEKIRGDRTLDVSKLALGKWDAVVDTCGYYPRVVRMSAEALKNSVEHYTFVSSISVYPDFSRVGITEESPVGMLEDSTVEEITGETYGPLKALCEQAAEEALPDRVLNVRPGLIVGPYDPTDRFTYWPWRISQGGDVLAPGNPSEQVSFIDARDLANWILDSAIKGRVGTFNADGPAHTQSEAETMGGLLESCNATGGNKARLRWASAEFLAANNVVPWSDMPVWVPDDAESRGFHTVDCSKAVASGLKFRSTEDTVHDTLEWAKTELEARPLRAGITRQRESELVQKLS